MSYCAAQVVRGDSFVFLSGSSVSFNGFHMVFDDSYVLFSYPSMVFNRSSAVFSASFAGRRSNEVLLYYGVEYSTAVTNYYQWWRCYPLWQSMSHKQRW
jgi:hypothetical protein